ncbi:uroporphyrinogen-III synthase [Amphiplicatus metriothermophilus]|nr:uroporphyrinogen-III synthase [Amphiplicatus metriothermophilus]MBB5517567.1 uroporphyrinogen-III synthase [Amphiplicatus metriothermophilus]
MRRPVVIVTRPEPDASRFADAARRAGLEPALSPAMRIVFRPGAPDLAGVGAIAFTSANGVRAFAAAAAIPPETPVFAVGPASAEAARDAGFADVAAAGGDVAALARMIGEARQAGRIAGAVLHACGSDRAGDLVAALAQAGAPARRAVLYEARANEGLAPAAIEALEGARAGAPGPWVALFSPRTARLFLDQVRAAGMEDRLAAARAACLSGAVAEAAGAARWREIAVAPAPTAETMIALMAQAL